MTKILVLSLTVLASSAAAQMYGPDANCNALYTGSYRAEIACQEEQARYRSRVEEEKRQEKREWRRRELWRDIDQRTLDWKD
jgi:hypothetical protein